MINKEEKYDRQLRLWATSGQSRLEHAHILVCQPNICSLELLKNLILPGIGQFTILSTKHAIDDVDLSANFYLDDDDLGKDWASTVVGKLGEMNEDVEGNVVHVEDYHSWWTTVDKSFWKDYDLVVMPFEYQHVMKDLYELKVPTIIINAVGFYGFMRIVTNCYEIIDTHPQSLPELRELNPWPELQAYVDSIDFHSLSPVDQAKIPYLVIQMKALEQWKAEHDGAIPTNGKEKMEFKRLIESWKIEFGQLNVTEAADNSRKVFMDTTIRSNVKDIFSKLPEHQTDESSFWILAKALRNFVDKNGGLLPLKGDLPDMDSSSEQYISLQNVYRAKAERDLQDFKQELRVVLQGKESEIQFSDDVVRSFVKNCNHLLYSKNTYVGLNDKNFSHVISGDLNQSATVLLAYIIVEKYMLEHNAFPAMDSLGELVEKSHEYFLTEETSQLEKVLFEMLRSRGVELGNIAALMGGIGGQEAIKLITNQYIPLDNTLVFDGVRSVTERWKVD